MRSYLMTTQTGQASL